MITDDMPRKLPHLQRETTRHGATVWFVRVDRGKRFRVRGDHGTAEFIQNYRDALAMALGQDVTPASRGTVKDTRSLAWLVGQWKRSSDWASTARATQRQRENILIRVIDANPTARYAAITAKHIAAGRERRQATPAAANNFVKTMRALFRWALDAGLVETNPAASVKFIPNKSPGFIPWSADDLERFRARWPLGTRERVACELIASTGLRRGDAVRLGRQHVRDGVAMITAEKTGADLFLPILPSFQQAIDAGPVGDLTYITASNGLPMVKESFGNWFREACSAAKVKGSAHGLRKLAATISADAGASENELQALFGWQTNTQSAVYTRNADRRRLAKQAAEKLRSGLGESRTLSKVRERE